MFNTSSVFRSCYSGECYMCWGCLGGDNNTSMGYKFPKYVIEAEKQHDKEEKRKLKVQRQFKEMKEITKTFI